VGTKIETTRLSRRAAMFGAPLALLAACARPSAPAGTVVLDRKVIPAEDLISEVEFDEASAPDTEPAVDVFAPQEVDFDPTVDPGQILVARDTFFLYWVHSPGKARRYGVGLGRLGLEFEGSAIIQRKAEWPRWRPTDAMIEREPDKYLRYIDGVEGGPDNPLGARALYLYRNGVDTYYRIHGTNQPQSIGTAASNGCIRMRNDDVIDLYPRIPIGTKVTVV